MNAALVQNRLERGTRLLNDLKNHGNWILIFSDEKTFSDYLVCNKQNDRVVIFKNDVSEHRRLSTTKHSVSTIMLCVFLELEEDDLGLL